MHAIDDPTAFVEHEAAYRASLEGARSSHGAHRGVRLGQTFARETEHSELSAAEYADAVKALAGWVRTGRKPTPAPVAASCPAFDAVYGTGCFFAPDYSPRPYATRVYPRPGGAAPAGAARGTGAGARPAAGRGHRALNRPAAPHLQNLAESFYRGLPSRCEALLRSSSSRSGRPGVRA